jgi:hypothetical protein
LGERKTPLADRSLKAFNHSPGFSWGYGESGPAQFALAILLRHLPERDAVSLHRDFRWKSIAALPQEDFETEINIREWIAEAQRCDPAHGSASGALANSLR